MAEENTYAGPYAQPPDGLEEEVVKAVLTRLENGNIRGALGVTGDGGYRAQAVQEVAMFGLSTQQSVTVEGLRALEKPSNWGFLIQLAADNGNIGTEIVFAAAGPAVGGTSYRYSTIINVPESLKRAKILEIAMARSVNGTFAFLQVPAYQLRAIWFRTERPEDDYLYFVVPTYGRFSDLGIPSKLVDLVDYMNASLAAGAPLLKEKDRGDHNDASEMEPDTKK